MIPESDLIREARARAALAGGEPAVSVAAAEAKATARAKGARAVAARQAAIAKAHAAKAAAKAAQELAALPRSGNAPSATSLNLKYHSELDEEQGIHLLKESRDTIARSLHATRGSAPPRTWATIGER